MIPGSLYAAILLIGGILFVIGVIRTLMAMIGHRKAPFREIYWRGSFQRRQDYTPEGWRLYVSGTRVGAIGFALAWLAALLYNW